MAIGQSPLRADCAVCAYITEFNYQGSRVAGAAFGRVLQGDCADGGIAAAGLQADQHVRRAEWRLRCVPNDTQISASSPKGGPSGGLVTRTAAGVSVLLSSTLLLPSSLNANVAALEETVTHGDPRE